MKKCKSGYYYCNTDKKCKPIPRGYRVGYGGYLRKENDDDSKSKSNGNGNGNGNGSNGNGNGGNGSGGGGNGGGMGESVIHESDDFKKIAKDMNLDPVKDYGKIKRIQRSNAMKGRVNNP